jgi:hypothetical protein
LSDSDRNIEFAKGRNPRVSKNANVRIMTPLLTRGFLPLIRKKKTANFHFAVFDFITKPA